MTARNIHQLWSEKGKNETNVGQAISHLLQSTQGLDLGASSLQGAVAFSGVSVDGDTVTIFGRTFEFDTNASVVAGNIAVDVSGGASAAQSVTALKAVLDVDPVLGGLLSTIADPAATLNLISVRADYTKNTLGTITEALTNGTVEGFVLAPALANKETVVIPATAAMTAAAKLWFSTSLTTVDFVRVTEIDVDAEGVNTEVFNGAAVTVSAGVVAVDLSGGTAIPALAAGAIALVEAYENL